ncbi:MAG: hypothetical protein AMXMBFR23_24850 [Chloroflexota bacterium]
MFGSFRLRLLSGFAIVIALTLFLSASAFIILLRDRQADAAEARIGLLVGPITEATRQRELLGWPVQLIRAELTAAAEVYELRVLLLDGTGRVVMDTDPEQRALGQVIETDFTEAVSNPGMMLAFRTQRVSVAGDDLYLFVASDAPGAAARQDGAARVVVAVPAGDVRGAWEELLPRLGMAGLGAGVVAVVFASLFASRITTPIAQMTRASQAMAQGDLDQRIDVDGTDEVGRLAEAFNLMSSRISRSDQSMRDLLANVSHELKTPLTSIQGFSQAIVDGIGGDPKEAASLIHTEAERIRVLVDDLLYLSEIESGTLRLDFEEVDLDAVLTGTLQRFRFQAEEREVALESSLAGGSVRADGRRLEQVFANLMDNAIRFTPPGTPVRVTAKAVSGGALVEVHNGGDPIPEEAQARVFDRFYQVDRARSSGPHRGLGLSIVSELVQAHGGSVSVESTAERGTTFSVFLPAVPPARTTSSSAVAAAHITHAPEAGQTSEVRS